MVMHSFFRWPALSEIQTRIKLAEIQTVAPEVTSLQTIWRFYVETAGKFLPENQEKLCWFLAETFEPKQFGSYLSVINDATVIEVGPRRSLVTFWSTNAQSIVRNCGLNEISRIERARLYLLVGLNPINREQVKRLLFDRMTEEVYSEELTTFIPDATAPPVGIIPVLEQGKEALRHFCKDMGLALNDRMMDYVCKYYCKLNRNPTDVELFMDGQLWSEHCRHLIWNALFEIDGVLQPSTLMQMVRDTMTDNRGNVAVAFKDNAAIIDGKMVLHFVREDPTRSSYYILRWDRISRCWKVETHNHPTAISSYAGEATGLAVRRDIEGAGRGGVPRAHLACNYVGNLFIPGYVLPWEKEHVPHPNRLERPLSIIINASNGGADNANCAGQPLILGSYTSFDEMIGGENYAWVKTCCVAGSMGYMDSRHIEKREPQVGWLVVQFGGDAFSIGLGGGSGSSQNAGGQSIELDFNSVQRADPETELKNIEVERAFSEMGDDSPIEVITDLGAGGDCVALPELIFPAGAEIDLDELPCGDPSMASFVLWCNESQERMVALIKRENLKLFERVCVRERCQFKVIGVITGDGKLTLKSRKLAEPIVVDMDFLLADLPQMKISCQTLARELEAPVVPQATVAEHLNRTQRLPKVARKSHLTDKGDMTVGALVAQNQIVGPAHLPLADCAVLTDSFHSTTGVAYSIGEQPIKSLVNNRAGIRLSVVEALTNLASARVNWEDINLSCTWQWPGGQPGEDARIYEAVKTLHDFCKHLGLRVPVGKDSMRMSVVSEGKVIKSPGTVQVIPEAECLDVRKTLTPDIKCPGKTKLMHLDLSAGLRRLGGSALLQVYKQVGDKSPDVYRNELVKLGFQAIQHLNQRGFLLSLHDISDGGFIQCALEMAYAGNCGFKLKLKASSECNVTMIDDLFAEEPGWIFEYLPEHEGAIRAILRRFGLTSAFRIIGSTLDSNSVKISYDNKTVLAEVMSELRAIWSETSFQHDRLQCNPECVEMEKSYTSYLPPRQYQLSFTPRPTRKAVFNIRQKPVVGILREEGTNGQWELAAAFEAAGFSPLDVHWTDLISGQAKIQDLAGISIAGGFANSDVFDAGKGIAGVTKFNPRVAEQFEKFLHRDDSFGFFPCNGCQAAALLGIVPWRGIESQDQPRFIRNTAERFQSRPVMLKILDSNCIFLEGMAGSVLPIWVAHGEGRFHCPKNSIMGKILAGNLAPVRYADVQGEITEKYPFNPNGSPSGIAGLTTTNGRFLAMMPHPERCFRPADVQAQCWPRSWRNLKASPWLQLFQNAYKFAKA